MRFSKIIGKCDPKIISEAENKLSSVFIELSMDYSTKPFGSTIGGDVFLHQMVFPLKHICDVRSIEFEDTCKKLEEEFKISNTSPEEQIIIIDTLKKSFGGKLLNTASTNGKEYFWSPQFINKLSKIGLRLVIGHEGWHCIYMHPSRRGSRNKALYNIAVDFKVNYTLMQDLRNRKIFNPEEIFRKELGPFITLEEYIDFLKNPFNPPDKLKKWNPIYSLKQIIEPDKQNTTNNDVKTYFYAEPNLAGDLKKPENIYQYILNHIPKCGTCGKIGVWKKPKELLDLEKIFEELYPDNKKKNNSCPECGGDDSYHSDPFKFGDLIDEHIDTEIEEDELIKRVSSAMDMASKLSGKLPDGIEDEFEQLTKPRLTWQDFIRNIKAKRKQTEKKNNWNTPKRKPLFYGLYVPQKTDHVVKFLLAYDCSGSMSKEHIEYGISQVAALNEKGEGYCLPWDHKVYYDSMVKIKNARPEELRNAKYKGGGGTLLSPLFQTYQKEVGKVDIIIIVSDFLLADEQEIMKLKQPDNTEVVWLSINGNPNFEPPFGRIFKLIND